MPLSVLSALARLEIDPWQEAANLALLPGATATRRLAALIASLPDHASIHHDPDTIAARLVARLPRRTRSGAALLKTFLGAGRMIRSLAFLYVMLMVIALGTEWIVALHQVPGQVDKGRAAVSASASPPSASIHGQ